MRQTIPRSAPAGFTLVELLIVVVILAILAAVVIPVANNVSNEAEQSSFATDLSIIATAFELYFQVNDDWPEDAGSGAFPSGLDKYMRASDWTKGTPIGGVWDSEKDSFGVVSAFGVHFMGVTPKPTAYMVQLDTLFDDGDLNTGTFRQIASDRYYYVVRE